MGNDTTIKERLKEFVGSQRISIREFERRCDLGNSFVNHIGNTIGADKLERIVQEYPELNRTWLLTGEGTMTMTPSMEVKVVSQHKGTPIYNMDATCGEVSRPIDFAQESIIGYVDMPNLSKDAAIIRANGDSMVDKIHDGDWIAVREIEDLESIFYGMIYLVITKEYRMLKYIRKYKEDEDRYVILRSENEAYDDIKMPKNKILRLFIVENILALKIQF